MMFALLGLYDYYMYTNDMTAKELFDKGVNNLKEEIWKYNNDGYSYYDLLGNPSGKYHPIHVDLTKKFYDITGQEDFQRYHNLWKEYHEPFKFAQPGVKTFLLMFFLLILTIEVSFYVFTKRYQYQYKFKHNKMSV